MKKTYNLVAFVALFIIVTITPTQIFSADGSWVDKGNYLEQTLNVPDISFIKYTASSEFIYTFGKDLTLRKWDAASGKLISEKLLQDCSKYLYKNFDISKDGKYALFPVQDSNNSPIYHHIVKYDLEKDIILLKLQPDCNFLLHSLHSGVDVWIFGLEMCPRFNYDDSQIIIFTSLSLENATMAATGAIHYFNSGTGMLLSFNSSGSIDEISFSNDGLLAYSHYLAEGYFPSKYYYGFNFNGNLKGIDNNDAIVRQNGFSNNGEHLFGVNLDSLFIWNTSNKELEKTIIITQDINNAMNQKFFYSNDDKFILFDDFNQINYIYTKTGQILANITLPYSNQRIFAKNPNNGEFAFTSIDGYIRILKEFIPSDVEDNEQNISNNNFEISPNPVLNSSIITFNTELNDIIGLYVYNELGQLAAEVAADEINGNQTYVFNTNNLNLKNGIYYIQLITKTGSLTKLVTVCNY